jgi:hypothetical protein
MPGNTFIYTLIFLGDFIAKPFVIAPFRIDVLVRCYHCLLDDNSNIVSACIADKWWLGGGENLGVSLAFALMPSTTEFKSGVNARP